MKKILTAMLFTGMLLLSTACGQSEAIPEPGDPDFIGPLPAEMIEKDE